MGLLDRIERLREDNQKWEQGDINAAQVGVRTAGETVGALGDVVEPVVPAASWLNEKAKALNPVQSTLSDTVAPFFKEAIQAVMDDAKNSPLYKIGEKYIKDHPEVARDVAMGANAMALLPGGAMLKGGKKLATYGDDALKGGTLSNFSNWIKNHYGPERQLTKTEQMMSNQLQKVADKPIVEKVASKVMPGGVSGKGADAAVLKGTSFGTHAIDSAQDAISHLLSPTSRANYGQNAVSSGSQRHVKGELALQGTPTTAYGGVEGAYTRAGEKGVAQAMYGSHHIPAQANRVGDVHPVVKEINDRAFATDPIEATRENLRGYFSGAGHKVDKARGTRDKKLEWNSPEWRDIDESFVDEKASDFAARYIMDKQKVKPGTQFVAKPPSAIQSGGHWNDVVYKNPASRSIADVFSKFADADGNVDLETLFNQLEGVRDASNASLKKAGRVRDSWRVVNKDMDHVRKNGLWLAGGKGGSAVTEGGVMWLQKLEPNGNTTTWMVDKHDFLENAIPEGLLDKLLPTDMLAVTAPMKGNIKEIKTVRQTLADPTPIDVNVLAPKIQQKHKLNNLQVVDDGNVINLTEIDLGRGQKGKAKKAVSELKKASNKSGKPIRVQAGNDVKYWETQGFNQADNGVMEYTPYQVPTKEKLLVPGEHFNQPRGRKTWEGVDLTGPGGLLDQYANIMPSKRNVNAERLKLGGRAAQLGGLLYAGDN